MRANSLGRQEDQQAQPGVERRPDVAVVGVHPGVEERLRLEVDRAAQAADHQLAVADRVARAHQQQPGRARGCRGSQPRSVLTRSASAFERAPVVRHLQLEAERLERRSRWRRRARRGCCRSRRATGTRRRRRAGPVFAFTAKRDCTRTSVAGRGAGSRSTPACRCDVVVAGAGERGSWRRGRPRASAAGAGGSARGRAAGGRTPARRVGADAFGAGREGRHGGAVDGGRDRRRA